jgi:hypothetical protein
LLSAKFHHKSRNIREGRPKGTKSKKQQPLAEIVDILILKYLSKYNSKDYTFSNYASNKADVLGSGSKKATSSQQQLRIRVNLRKHYLQTHKTTLFQLLREKGLKTF